MKTPTSAQNQHLGNTVSRTGTRLEADKIVITLRASSSFEEWSLYMNGFVNLAHLIADPATAERIQASGVDLQWLTKLGLALSELDSQSFINVGLISE